MLTELDSLAIAEGIVNAIPDFSVIEAEAAAVSRGDEQEARNYKAEVLGRVIFEQARRISRNDRALAMARLYE